MPRKNGLFRSAALVAAGVTAMVTLAACGSDGDSDGGRKGKGSGESSSDNAADSQPGGSEESEDPAGEEGNLQLGEASSEPVKISRSDKTGEFEVTMEKVVMGKPGDLDELKEKEEYKGKVPAWLYATYKHVGGDEPAQLSSNDLGLMVEGGEQARPLLILMGGLSATPDDCTSATSVEPLKAGESATVCRLFVVPEDEKVDTALLSRGFTTPPTKWDVN